MRQSHTNCKTLMQRILLHLVASIVESAEINPPHTRNSAGWGGVSGEGSEIVCVFSVTFQNSEFSEFRICMRACMTAICSSRYMLVTLAIRVGPIRSQRE